MRSNGIASFLAALMLLLSQCSGGAIGGGSSSGVSSGGGAASAPASQAPAEQAPAAASGGSQPAAPAAPAYNLFYDMPSSFYFSSGVGGWGTSLDIDSDGYFYGSFHDSDMGDTGDGYPNGTVYFCEFSGRFTQPVQIDDFTWSMYVEYLDYDRYATSYFDNGTRWIPGTPYGLENAYEVWIFEPGMPVARVPEEFMFWDYMDYNATTLSCWGLYNVSEQLGFVSG